MHISITPLGLKSLVASVLITVLLLAFTSLAGGCSASEVNIINKDTEAEALELDSSKEIKVLRNLRYGDQPSGTYATDASSDRLLDLYLPVDNGSKKAVFLFIHGGGFTGGDKSSLENFWRSLAAEGFAVISANYRLYLKHFKTPGAGAATNMKDGLPKTGQFHPGLQTAVNTATEDVTKVLEWIREVKGEYNFDLEKIVVAGGSAGAMTALNLAYASGQNVLAIQAVVNLWGGLQDASVIRKGAPPILTFHGDQDEVIHVDYAYALDSRMKEIGNYSELHVLKGKGHAIYQIIAAEHVGAIVSFLRKNHLKK